MKRILFIVIPEKGHINPYIGVAKYLKKIGFEIGFYSSNDISPQLNAAGLFNFLGERSPLSPSSLNKGEVFAKNVSDKSWLKNWIKELLIDNSPSGIQPIKLAIENFKPDIIVTDPMIYPAAIAAHQTETKWVAISNSLNLLLNGSIKSELLETVDWISSDRISLFEQHGLNLSFKGCDMLSPFMNIAFTTKEFIGYVPDQVHLVGPSLPEGNRGDETPFPWEKLDKNVPIIYMSLGSQIYHQPEMFEKIFKAVKNKPVQLIATANELISSFDPDSVPSNVILSYYTPQLELLPSVDLMITHGGANSVMEAISFGVPMIVTPICNDQFHQVHFIEKQKVGVYLDLLTATPYDCWKSINETLNSVVINKNIKRVTKSYQTDGAMNAANLVISLMNEGFES
jgi:MGT family glycosyltransferase